MGILHATCIGGRAAQISHTHKDFQDVSNFLKGKEDRTVLVKMDIEGSEFAVLREIDAQIMKKIAYLTVEFHFLYDRCRNTQELKQLFSRLSDEFIVVDGAA